MLAEGSSGDIGGIFSTRIMPFLLIRNFLELVCYWASPIRFVMGLVNIDRICSAWEIRLSKCIDVKAVPVPGLKMIYGMERPSLGNQTPLPDSTPDWKTQTHKRYILKDRSLLRTLGVDSTWVKF